MTFTGTWAVTQRDIRGRERSYQIALKQGNQNPQNDMIASFSFASTAHVAQWSHYLTQRREIFNPTIKFNASTDEEYREWFVCGSEVAFDIKQVGFTPSPLFSPRPASCGRQLLRMAAFLPTTSLLLNTLRINHLMKKDLINVLAPPFAYRQNCSHNRAAKRKNLFVFLETHR